MSLSNSRIRRAGIAAPAAVVAASSIAAERPKGQTRGAARRARKGSIRAIRISITSIGLVTRTD